MGRYYDGDIEGKFWVAVQSSDDGEFFGAYEVAQNYINYCVDDLDYARDKVKECEHALGEYLPKMDAFFNGCCSYNDMELGEALDVESAEVKDLLIWYARLEMGRKIVQAMEDRDGDAIYFEAEC